MKRIFVMLVLVGVAIVGLGFYQGWFHAGSDNAAGKSNVTLSMDTDKITKDKNTAVANVQTSGARSRTRSPGRATRVWMAPWSASSATN